MGGLRGIGTGASLLLAAAAGAAGSQYAPSYLNDFGGHFVITPEMRTQASRSSVNDATAVR